MKSSGATNVPTGRSLGTNFVRLADFGDEDWVAIEREEPPSAPLATVLFLDRRAGGDPVVVPFAPSLADLHPQVLGHGLDANCERRRFATCAQLAGAVPTGRLRTRPDAPPSALADAVEAWVAALPTRTPTV